MNEHVFSHSIKLLERNSMLQPYSIIFAQALAPENKITLYPLCSYFLLIKHATSIYGTPI